MKNRYLILVLAICSFLSISTFYACSEDDEHITNNIYYDLTISNADYEFPNEGGDFTLTVTTDYDGDWEAAYTEASWINETGRTSNSITFTAVENTTDEENSLTVTIKAGDISRTLTLTQESVNSLKSNFHAIEGYHYATSNSGLYIVTAVTEADNSGATVLKIYLTNTETDEISLVYETANSIVSNIVTVSDDGKIFGYTNQNTGFYIENGVLTEISISGYNVQVNDATADGKIIVGTAYNTTDRLYYGFIWENGSATILPLEPATGRVSGSAARGIMVEAISPDGNYLVGRFYSGSGNEGIYWKKENGAWQYYWMGDIVTEEVDTGYGTYDVDFYCQNSPNMSGRFSPNSRYFATSFLAWGQSFFGAGTVYVPALFDFEEEKFIGILDEIIDIRPYGGVSVAAFDDGSISYYLSVLWGDPATPYIWNDGVSVSAKESMEQMFGIYMGEEILVKKLIDNELLIGSFLDNDGNLIPFYAKPSSIN